MKAFFPSKITIPYTGIFNWKCISSTCQIDPTPQALINWVAALKLELFAPFLLSIQSWRSPVQHNSLPLPPSSYNHIHFYILGMTVLSTSIVVSLSILIAVSIFLLFLSFGWNGSYTHGMEWPPYWSSYSSSSSSSSCSSSSHISAILNACNLQRSLHWNHGWLKAFPTCQLGQAPPPPANHSWHRT